MGKGQSFDLFQPQQECWSGGAHFNQQPTAVSYRSSLANLLGFDTTPHSRDPALTLALFAPPQLRPACFLLPVILEGQDP